MAMGMIPILIMYGLAGSGNDFFEYLPLDDFWKSQKVAVSADSMKSILIDAPAADVSELVGKLGSERFIDRENAYTALKRAGGAILPQITKAAAAATDVEVRQRLKQIIDDINQRNASRATLQMVALLTIQKHKYTELLPTVRQLADNPNPLVAQYAAKTIATLEGKPFKPAAPSRAMFDEDLALLPADVGTIARVLPPHTNPTDIFKPLKALAGLGGGGVDIESKLKEQIVKAALRVGNVRIDSLVLGVADDVSDRKGYAVFVLRGYYSPDAMLKLLEEENHGLAKRKVEGMDVYSPDDHVAILCPSNQRLIFIVGARSETLPISKVIKSLNAKTKKPTFNGDITKLLAKIDRTKMGWVVSQMNDSFREAPPFEPFDWIVGEADQDEKGVLNIKFWGEGADAEAIAKTMKKGRKELKKSIAQMKKFGAAMPMMGSFVKIMKSIELENKGTHASVSLKIDNVSDLMMSPMLMFGMAFRDAPAVAVPVEKGPIVEPVRPIRVEPKRELRKKARPPATEKAM
jgi:hypothetical protein